MAADSLLNLAGVPPKDVTWEDPKARPRYGAHDPPSLRSRAVFSFCGTPLWS